MKNIIIGIIMCVTLLAAAPQVQAAPKALSAKQKHQYSQQEAALPASFGQEQGEELELVVAVLLALAITFLIISAFDGGHGSMGDRIDNRIDGLFNGLSAPSSGGGTTSQYSPPAQRGYQAPAQAAPLRGYAPATGNAR